MNSFVTICLVACLASLALARPQEYAPQQFYPVEQRQDYGSEAQASGGNNQMGYRLGMGLGAVNGLVKALIQKRSGGYGGGGYGGGYSQPTSFLGNILRSLTGVGVRLGLNLDNQIYKAKDDYGYGGSYGGGSGYGGGYGGGNAGGNAGGYGGGQGY